MRGTVIEFNSATGAGYVTSMGKDFYFTFDGQLAVGQVAWFQPSDFRGEFTALDIQPAPDPGSDGERRPRRELMAAAPSSPGPKMPAAPIPSGTDPQIPQNGAGPSVNCGSVPIKAGKLRGRIVFFHDAKRFGSIGIPGRKPDLYFHASEFRGAIPTVGLVVDCRAVAGHRRPWEAVEVTPVFEMENEVNE